MLASRKAIHLFAEIWMSRFQCNASQSSAFFIHDFESWFGPECKLLGFEMDFGHKFESRLKQEKAAHPDQPLANLVSNIYNWETLGSALHSKWRYLTHWSSEPLSESIPNNTEWFLLLLRQLYNSSAPSKKD